MLDAVTQSEEADLESGLVYSESSCVCLILSLHFCKESRWSFSALGQESHLPLPIGVLSSQLVFFIFSWRTRVHYGARGSAPQKGPSGDGPAARHEGAGEGA